ncbi:unnamed protein product, partial [Polarella glacialis]
ARSAALRQSLGDAQGEVLGFRRRCDTLQRLQESIGDAEEENRRARLKHIESSGDQRLYDLRLQQLRLQRSELEADCRSCSSECEVLREQTSSCAADLQRRPREDEESI